MGDRYHGITWKVKLATATVLQKLGDSANFSTGRPGADALFTSLLGNAQIEVAIDDGFS